MGTLLVRHPVTPETGLGTAGTSASASRLMDWDKYVLPAMLFK
jgi:hypothetical protein